MRRELFRSIRVRNAHNYIELIRIEAFANGNEQYRKALIGYHESRLDHDITSAKPGMSEPEQAQVLKAMFGMYRHSLHMPQVEN